MGVHLRLSVEEYDQTLTRIMRECLADGVFPSIKQVVQRGMGGDNSKIGRAIRAKIQSGEIEIPASLPGLKAAHGQWMRAGKRELTEAQLEREARADARIPAKEIAARAAEIKAENIRAGKVGSWRPIRRNGAARAAMTPIELALSDYRGAWRRIQAGMSR